MQRQRRPRNKKNGAEDNKENEKKSTSNLSARSAAGENNKNGKNPTPNLPPGLAAGGNCGNLKKTAAFSMTTQSSAKPRNKLKEILAEKQRLEELQRLERARALMTPQELAAAEKIRQMKLQEESELQMVKQANLSPRPASGKNYDTKKTIKKTVADFKCTGESCGKTWSSVHAWASPQVMCHFCDAKAKVVKLKDETCELDYYCCSSCNNSWQSIHSDTIMEQPCHNCNRVVRKKVGTQLRFGRHYWYKCMHRECALEWEDFYQGRSYSQRCKACFSAGEMFRTRQALNVHEIQRRAGSRFFNEVGGGHNVLGCDMCHEFQRQGVAKSCVGKKKVVFQLDSNQGPDGAVTERIVDAV